MTILCAAACTKVEEPPAPAASDQHAAVQETRVKKWVEYRDGKVVWEFRGDLLRYYENPERVEADGLIVDFYENEKYSTTLTADHGTMHRGSSDMQATGNVIIENVKGTRVETESIQYQDEQERIFTDDFVTILRGNKKITGYGLETDPKLNETLIKRDVVAKTIDRSR